MHTERIQNPLTIDETFIDQAFKVNDQVVVQFSEKLYNDKLLSEINELCFKYDERFMVRFFGHYNDVFDCNIVARIPNVKSLGIDCLRKASNMDALFGLNFLKKLILGVYELDNTEILAAENFKSLQELWITDTKTKALNLEYLKEYKNLTYLINAGHTKNIEAIGSLKHLESLSLNSIRKISLDFINDLEKLKTLRIILGGRKNIHEIKGNNIENLGLIWIRGFDDLSNIGNFTKLRSLLVQDQIQLSSIHFNRQLNIRDIKIFNCKTLSSISGLNNLNTLNEIRVSMTNIDIDSLMNQSLPVSLKILAFYTGKSKLNKQIKDKLLSKGYVDGLER